MARTGGQVLVDQLRIQGVTQAFGVPGESYLAVLDALHDAPEIAFTVCRHEGGAAMAAEAWGKLTGRPGICFVTRGPGSTNAMAGLHVATQDSTPMILFVGQVGRRMKGREAFQELDYPRAFAGLCKWAVDVDDPERLPEFVARAFAVAMNGRPGPVVVALPEDMLTEAVAVADAPRVEPVAIHPGAAQVEDLVERVRRAQRPVAIVGGSGWDAEAVERLAAFAAALDLPVATSFRRQMLFPADHPCYAGTLGLGPNPALVRRVKDADLVLLLGGRLSEVPSQGYTLLGISKAGQALVHVHADAAELGRVYLADLQINATPRALAAALPRLTGSPGARAAAAHAELAKWRDPAASEPPGALKMNQVMAHLLEVMPPETILANGAGNFATWVDRFWRFRSFGGQLAPTSGSMGYAMPAALAAGLACPDRPVLAFTGDGDFLMTGQEFTTAVQYGAKLVVVLLDNAMYGTIRMHQERHYPGRISATAMRSPDFVAMARAMGGHAERVERTEDFAAALARARAAEGPALLHLIVDPDAINPATTLTAIRAQAAGNG